MNPGPAISAYCERLDGSFWSEPANALTNIAFLATAVGILCILPGDGRRNVPVHVLIALCVSIAVGSFLFHTRPGPITVLLDVIPIALFIHFYFFCVMKVMLRLDTARAVVATAAFFLVGLAVGTAARPIVGSSAAYLPALLALFGVGAVMVPRQSRIATGLITAGLMFSLSLAFRMLDRPVCNWFPIGTHFMWHVLNAVVLYMLLRVLVHAQKPGVITQ